ncbi:hypothetical protein D049_3296B, partial [Vibrio parahaemolyticus VPTS-2010]
VIHHANGLHKGITDGFTDKLKAFLFEKLTHGFGLFCRSRYVTHFMPLIYHRLAIDKLPQRL